MKSRIAHPRVTRKTKNKHSAISSTTVAATRSRPFLLDGSNMHILVAARGHYLNSEIELGKGVLHLVGTLRIGSFDARPR
jgi:hypothetical protein